MESRLFPNCSITVEGGFYKLLSGYIFLVFIALLAAVAH